MSVPVEEKLLKPNIRLLVRLRVLSSALQPEVVPPPSAPAPAPSAPPPPPAPAPPGTGTEAGPEDTNPPIRGSGRPIDGRSHTDNNNNVSQVQVTDRSGQLPSYLSALSAVSVNTDTPTEVSWMTGMSLHAASPNTHSSEK